MKRHNIAVDADYLRNLAKQNCGMTAAARRLLELDKPYSLAVLARMLAHMTPLERETLAGVLLDLAAPE